MKILVTGASGFIGGRFARFALEQGLSVRVNGRRPEAVEGLVARGAEFVQGDLLTSPLPLLLTLFDLLALIWLQSSRRCRDCFLPEHHLH